MLHLLPWRSLSKDCLRLELVVNFTTIFYVYLLNLKGFLVERTDWDYFLALLIWDLPMESVLLICFMRYSFFSYSSIILEIFLAASWISDLPFLTTCKLLASFSGQYMLDHLNLFSLENERNGDTNLIVAYESFQSLPLWKELAVL